MNFTDFAIIGGGIVGSSNCMIASFGMALRYLLGLGDWADKLDAAISACLAKGLRTKDIAGENPANTNTSQMGDAILKELQSV
jgi:3-isopropylmalate dehydrogenase